VVVGVARKQRAVLRRLAPPRRTAATAAAATLAAVRLLPGKLLQEALLALGVGGVRGMGLVA
jgi:hypothetical protein